MKLSVLRALLVMPRRSGLALAGLPPFFITFSFSSWKMNLSTCSSTRNSVSPTSSTLIQRSIWRMIVSMCLSLIVTPWSR